MHGRFAKLTCIGSSGAVALVSVLLCAAIACEPDADVHGAPRTSAPGDDDAAVSRPGTDIDAGGGEAGPTNDAGKPTGPLGKLEFASFHRLTPPSRGVADIHYAEREPWNLAVDRIAFHESGRLVWAFLDDLKKWTNEAEFLAAVNAFPTDFSIFTEWSPLPGEDNIVYAANKATKMIVRFDVDTQMSQNIVSFDPQSGGAVDPFIKGWTSDGHLIVNINGEVWGDGAYEIDVVAKTRVRHATAYYPDPARWPDVHGHGHSTVSADRKRRVIYDSQIGWKLTSGWRSDRDT